MQLKLLVMALSAPVALNAYFHERRSLNNFHRDRVITAFFKVVVAFCNKITLCSLFFWIQVDF